MFTLKTGQATQYLEEGVTLLAVPFDIINEKGETVYSLSQSFALNASAEDITAMLQRHLEVYTEDSARYEAGKEQQAALEASVAVIDQVSNSTLDVKKNELVSQDTPVQAEEINKLAE